MTETVEQRLTKLLCPTLYDRMQLSPLHWSDDKDITDLERQQFAIYIQVVAMLRAAKLL